MNNMISNNKSRRPSEEVDVCIIGAGVAGGIVAYHLAKQGHDVVVLEAGPWFDKLNVSERMEKSIRPEHDRTDVWPEGIDQERDKFSKDIPDNITVELNRQRLKGIGGTTHHWGAYVGRLHEKDFNMQSRYGLASDWPIDYTDLQAYYAEAEAEMGVAGGADNPFIPRETPPPMDAHPLSFTDTLFQKACEGLEITTHRNSLAINSEGYDGRSQCVGYGTCGPVCPSGAMYSGDVHVRKAMDEGARIIDQAPAQRLEHDSSGEEVTSVVYATPDGEEHTQTARNFVVACGGIETPRLLLLSKSEKYPNGLANSSGNVGKYLMSTNYVSVEGELDKQANNEPVAFDTLISEYFYDHEDAQSGSFRLWFRNSDPDQPINSVLGGGITEPIRGSQWGDNLIDDLGDVTKNHSVSIRAQIEMLPKKSNKVSLNQDEVDKYDKPIPHITFDIGSHTINTAEFAIEVMKEILLEMGAEVTSVGDPADQSLGNHHKGTTRMGHNPNESVVDESQQTHDLDNLWIASSSVFPTGGAVNPTLTIAALAIKTANHIDERLR